MQGISEKSTTTFNCFYLKHLILFYNSIVNDSKQIFSEKYENT